MWRRWRLQLWKGLPLISRDVWLCLFINCLRNAEAAFWFSLSLSMWKWTCDLSMVYIHVCSLDKVLPAVARLKTVRIIEHLLNGLVVPKKNRVRLVLKDEYDLFFTTKNFFPLCFCSIQHVLELFSWDFFWTLKLGCPNIVVESENPLTCKNTSHNWKVLKWFKLTFFHLKHLSMNFISINSTPWRNVERERENGSYLYFFLLKMLSTVSVSEILLYHWYCLLLVYDCECMWDCEHSFYLHFSFFKCHHLKFLWLHIGMDL